MGGGTLPAIARIKSSEITPGPLGMEDTSPRASAPAATAIFASSTLLIQHTLTRGVRVDGMITPTLLSPAPLSRHRLVAQQDISIAEGRVFANTGQGVVEQYEAREERLGSGNTKDEEGARNRHGDYGKRQHCFTIGAGGFDR